MSRYGSIGEFRAALNGLIDSTGGAGRSRANPSRRGRRRGKRRSRRRGQKARQNMAVRVPFQGETIEFDTPQEAAEFMQQMGMAPGAPVAAEAPAPRGFGAAMRQAPKQSRRKKKRRGRRKFSGQMRDPGGPPSFAQAKTIGKSIGGMAAYCPQYAGRKVSHRDALAEMGLTKAAASAVITALKAAGVDRPHGGVRTTPAQQAQARQILAEVGGVVCPAPGRSNPVSWTRAY